MAEVSTQIREIENICKEITPFFDFSVQYGKNGNTASKSC